MNRGSRGVNCVDDAADSFCPPSTQRPDLPTEHSYVNALVGAAVTVVFAFLPLSPLLGGATAGYLERRDGARVGTISGVFAMLPVMVVVVLFGGVVFALLGFGNVFSGVVVLLLVGVFVAVYTVVLSAVGGVLGVYLAEEFGN